MSTISLDAQGMDITLPVIWVVKKIILSENEEKLKNYTIEREAKKKSKDN